MVTNIKAGNLQAGDVLKATLDSGTFSIKSVDTVRTLLGTEVRINGPLGILVKRRAEDVVTILNNR